MLGGPEGLIVKAQQAKEDSRGASIKEAVDLAIANNCLENVTDENIISRDDIIQELLIKGKLTEEEANELETTDIITIGNIEIDFSKLGETPLTLKKVYTDDMIGQKLTYFANGESDWIVFGKDKSGNILITTEKPIDEVMKLGGQGIDWLKYIENINELCSAYSGNIQGKNVNARSITMEDIDYVLGITAPETITYTASEELKIRYPKLEEDGTKCVWILSGETPEKPTFEENYYGYYETEDGKYYYFDRSQGEIDATTINMKTDNCKYIWGGNTQSTCYDEYLIATRSVYINSPDKEYSDAYFQVGYVANSKVSTTLTLSTGTKPWALNRYWWLVWN